jgi:hypothetical protein
MKARVPDFVERSKEFLSSVSMAAEWMMERNVGEGHWWRWIVLTKRNLDLSPRPVFDDHTSQRIFDELKRRELLSEIPSPDGDARAPSYLMRYDRDGWDRAVSDGRPIYGAWLKLRRNWRTNLVFLIIGVALDRSVGLIERFVGSLLGAS